MSAKKEINYSPAVYYRADKKYAGKTYITVYHNQRVVQLHKSSPFAIDHIAHNRARVSLSSSAFLIYDYFMCHSNKWIWPISPELISEKTNVGRTTYLRAIKELIDKGYLVQGKIDTGEMIIEQNAFHIFEDPVQVSQ